MAHYNMVSDFDEHKKLLETLVAKTTFISDRVVIIDVKKEMSVVKFLVEFKSAKAAIMWLEEVFTHNAYYVENNVEH